MEEKKLSLGSKIALVATSSFICSLILLTFFFSPSPFIITCPIIVLTCLLIIVVLSNSFDNLSVGKIISLKRSVNENKKRVEVLEKERSDFFLKLSNLNQQSQKCDVDIHQHFSGPNLSYTDGKEEKTHDEVRCNACENSQIELQSVNEPKSGELVEKSKIHGQQGLSIVGKNACHIINREKIEKFVLERYFGVGKKDYITQYAKLVDSIQDVDSISKKPVYFDAYLKDSAQEVFIEISASAREINWHDKLYVQLNKVLAYKKARNCDAYQLLIFAIEKGKMTKQIDLAINRIMEDFQPAISQGLLKIAKFVYDAVQLECESDINQDAIL